MNESDKSEKKEPIKRRFIYNEKGDKYLLRHLIPKSRRGDETHLIDPLTGEKIDSYQTAIYFYVGESKKRACDYAIYVGESERWPERVGEGHTDNVEKWIKGHLIQTVVFTPVKGEWDDDDRHYMENALYRMIDPDDDKHKAKKYELLNGRETYTGNLKEERRKELQKYIKKIIESMEEDLGYKCFERSIFTWAK